VELGIAMKKAMESAGKGFEELSAAEISAALRSFEMLRSHRVAHIIDKSRRTGNFMLDGNFFVSVSLPQRVYRTLEFSL